MIGDDLRVGVGVEAGVIGAVSLLASVDLAYDVETSSPSHALGIEALAAVRWRHGSGMSLTTGFGGGLGSGLGAALRWELDRVRLSAHWGAALGSAASDRLGAYTVGLSVDLGFGAL